MNAIVECINLNRPNLNLNQDEEEAVLFETRILTFLASEYEIIIDGNLLLQYLKKIAFYSDNISPILSYNVECNFIERKPTYTDLYANDLTEIFLGIKKNDTKKYNPKKGGFVDIYKNDMNQNKHLKHTIKLNGLQKLMLYTIIAADIAQTFFLIYDRFTLGQILDLLVPKLTN